MRARILRELANTHGGTGDGTERTENGRTAMVWTMFVGRQQEREVIDAFLRDTDPKTVVVRAAAGMGKTTLIQIGRASCRERV